MAKIRAKRTRPEMLLHGMLKGRKIRHAMWPDWIHGHPDAVIFEEDRDTVVFVNGCFWHGCLDHFKCPRTNRKFWSSKIERNARRQSEVSRALKKCGYRVLVFWEHDIVRKDGKRFLSRFADRMKKKI